MDIEIVTRDFSPTAAIREYVERKLVGIALWTMREVEHIRVTLGDNNGPRGGVDKYCRVHVRMAGGPDLTTEHVSDDLYHAISQAGGRAERAVRDELSRRRRRRRRKSLGVMWA